MIVHGILNVPLKTYIANKEVPKRMKTDLKRSKSSNAENPRHVMSNQYRVTPTSIHNARESGRTKTRESGRKKRSDRRRTSFSKILFTIQSNKGSIKK